MECRRLESGIRTSIKDAGWGMPLDLKNRVLGARCYSSYTCRYLGTRYLAPSRLNCGWKEGQRLRTNKHGGDQLTGTRSDLQRHEVSTILSTYQVLKVRGES